MKLNSAAKNLILCHLAPTPNALIAGQFKRILLTLRSGPVPTVENLKAAFAANDSIVATIPQATNNSILNALGGTTLLSKVVIDVPQFGALSNRLKRGYDFSTFGDELAIASGEVSWALVGISNESNYCHTFYVLTVGTIGSGADLEFENLNIVSGTKIKFSTLVLNHSFILAGV